MNTALPVSKRKRKTCKSKAEKMMEKAMEAFMVYQSEAEEKFMKSEEERWKKELKIGEEKKIKNMN